MQIKNIIHRLTQRRVLLLLTLILSVVVISIIAYTIFNFQRTDVCIGNNQCDSKKHNDNKEQNSNYNTQICWNKVIKQDEEFYWPDGCKGDPNLNICTLVLTKLTPEEINAYKAWINEGSKTDNLDPKCIKN